MDNSTTPKPPVFNDFNSFLECPAFVINLDRRPDRWAATKAELTAAGFKDIRRRSAVDAILYPEDCRATYEALGSPPRHPTFNRDFDVFPGTFGCFLSHLSLWKYLINQQIPYAIIFEDDIQFHTNWSALAPQYLLHSPPATDYDILYLGSQFEIHERMPKPIDSVPVFCTHAYAVSLAGVQRLYNYIMGGRSEAEGGTGGIYTIDIMLIEAMKRKTQQPFRWCVWNTWMYPCPLRNKMSPIWRKRNGGIVFQNEDFGTDVREYTTE